MFVVNPNSKGGHIFGGLTTVSLLMTTVLSTQALEVNKSNLWFGGDEGIEIIFRTGKNMAYDKPSPTVHLTQIKEV